jgi:ATP-dependent DNA helicase RecG
VRVELLAGSVKGAQRKRVLGGLASGTVQIVVGTHALFQEGVAFRDLGLAVVDEQHRFGVAQRLMLAEKGDAADMLVMTATPIPRTLLLTQWGEMAVSRLTGKPAGRQPISTRVVGRDKEADVYKFVRSRIDGGEQCYVVVPAVEESATGLKDAEGTARTLAAGVFAGLRVGVVHGQMDR